MTQTRLKLLNDLFHRWCGESIVSINKLQASGSPREYYRIKGKESSAIGAINLDREENTPSLNSVATFIQRICQFLKSTWSTWITTPTCRRTWAM